jgi:hypothetical protein
VLTVTAAPFVTTVSAMHEKVHEKTKKEGQPDERAKDMGAVFGEEQHSGDGEEAKQDKPCARCQEAALRLTSMLRVIMH